MYLRPGQIISHARTKIKYENEMSIEENITFPFAGFFFSAKFGVYYFSRIIRSKGREKTDTVNGIRHSRCIFHSHPTQDAAPSMQLRSE